MKLKSLIKSYGLNEIIWNTDKNLQICWNGFLIIKKVNYLHNLFQFFSFIAFILSLWKYDEINRLSNIHFSIERSKYLCTCIKYIRMYSDGVTVSYLKINNESQE
jgi:hypothetical protein